MSEENKDKGKFEFPMVPIYGVDLGERLGDLASGQRQLNARMDKFEAKFDTIDSRLDRVESRLDRLDERTKNLSMVTWGGTIVLLAAVIAGIIL